MASTGKRGKYNSIPLSRPEKGVPPSPIQTWEGVLPRPEIGWRYPPLGRMGYTPHQEGWGTPPYWEGRGYPPPPQVWTDRHSQV